MNCQSIQNQILGLADPAGLSGSLAGHVTGCADCQAWHRLLLGVEEAVTRLPVPASNGEAKRKLLSQFRVESPATPAKPSKKKTGTLPKVVSPALAREKTSLGDRMARLWPVGALALAVCVVVIVISQGARKNAPGPEMAAASDPMLERVVAAKVQLDVAENEIERLKVLARLADDVQDQAKSLYLLNSREEMASLSKMYDEIVSQGVVLQASRLSKAECRTHLDDYANRLARAEQQAQRMAAEAPGESRPALLDIAHTARDGVRELAKLREKAL